MEKQTNWAGNYEYGAARILRPKTVSELRELVASSSKCRFLGSRHSFNGIADTDGDLIELGEFNRIESIDQESMTVTVGGGISYGKLCPQLDRAGFAVHNLASLPHISVAGAVATATHGSGMGNGNLSSVVCGLEIVKADGTITNLSEDDKDLNGAIVGLGALGAVARLKLKLVPCFEVRQRVYEHLPFETLLANFDEVEASGYSVSLFTDWKRPEINQVWIKRIAGPDYIGLPDDFFGAKAAAGPRHPLPDMPAENCTEQMAVPGPWFERLPHFRMDFTPSSGEELQSEYFVPYAMARDALKAVAELSPQISPLLQISEIRAIAADELWMSPAYREACVGIHFTWEKNWEGVRAVLPIIEERLSAFNVRPHWGKLFTMSPEKIRARYPKLPDFKALVERFDPSGKFRNEYTSGLLA